MNAVRLVSKPFLNVAGWKFEGPPPTEKKCVCIAAPHTSNWDGLLLVTLAESIGMKMSWMIKQEWVRGPMGVVLRPLGAVAVDRSGSRNMVQQMIDTFNATDQLVLVIPPEGTRRRADYWKSGFYRIALGANVPIVPGYLDYGRKRAGIGSPIFLSGDVGKDMTKIREFYKEMNPVGRVPDHFGPIRLRDEDATPTS